MKSLRKFFADNHGFTGAEKALLTLLALGMILLVARFVLFGSSQTASTTRTTLENQTPAANVNFKEVDATKN